ncbi:MAG: hypothetical protein JWO36_685 [Myxococcales bacterium]|nr:hypothetical protein [Myxococcales bacterium]
MLAAKRSDLRSAVGLVILTGLTGCPAPNHPRGGNARAFTLEVGRPGASLRGVAGDRDRTFAAFTTTPDTTTDAASSRAARTTIEARRLAAIAWQVELDGTAGPLARARDLLAITLGGAPGLRGEPGAVVVALDASTGAARWRTAIDSTEWSVITSIAPAPDGFVVGGTFSGTLRAQAKVVSSAGGSDGFVARLSTAGDVIWLVRVGGAGADSVQGVAASPDRVAIAGTVTGGADLLGQPLPAFDERSPFADGFVAELDAAGARRWSATFGGKEDDSVAGVAIDASGRVAVAANARGAVHVGNSELMAQGPADGMVIWWQPGGDRGPTILLGGLDFDGLRGIAAVGDRVVVGGFFSGTMRLGDRAITAGGGDDAFLAALDDSGNTVAGWQVGGEGREDIAALAAIPDGFIAGVTHTATAWVEGVPLPAPKHPMSGAALVIRGVP